MGYFMGIDLGTSSVKVLIVDEKGAVISSAQKGYDIKKERLEYAEQNMDQLWAATRDMIAQAVKEQPEAAGQIQGISYSGQMHGLVMMDREGRLIRDAIIWADQRTQAEIQEIYEKIPAEEFKAVTKNSLSAGFLLPSLMWVRKHEPENFEKIYKVMLPKDYIRYQMSGLLGTDASDASSSVIFDTAKRAWAWELIDRLELPREIFPDCREAFHPAGEVTEKCARETGLKKGTPIVYGGGDTPMQAVGNGMFGPGVLASNIGTACQVACILDKPLADPQYRTNTFCHICDNTWMLMGAGLSGGVSLKWLMNQVLMMNNYDEMTALAATAPAGSEGLLFLPYLNGERTPHNDPNAKGIYLGLTLKHSREHIIRSTMEGIVYGLRSSLEIFDDLGVGFDKVIASGGGARGQLFLEIQADIYGKEIYTNSGNEQAGTGAAITAAVGVGAYGSFQEACGQMVHLNDHVVKPNMENHKHYAEQYQRFREIYKRNKDLF